jgi:hypothetical protein
MLWYKSWLETRWRFLIGLVLLLCSAAATVFTYPEIVKLLPSAPPNAGGILGEKIRQSVELAREYRGYVWSSWFRGNLAQWASVFGVLLGTAGVLSHPGGALFTLSLPVSRARLLAVRAATGLAELFVIAFIPSMLIPLFSPAIHHTYGVANALIHSACLFVAVAVFFSLAFLLSTVFDDPWRPVLIAIAIAFLLAVIDQLLNRPAFSIYRVMSGESYFRSGHVPWVGLLV